MAQKTCERKRNEKKISSTISMNAIKELELAVGKEAYAVIKATSVMIGIDD